MIKIQKFKKVRIAILINLMILLSAIYISNLDANRMNEYEENFQDYSSEKNLKKAGFWVLTPLVIDDDGGGDYTWLEASSEDWCSGSGTYSDPYVIENLIINGQNSSSCIEIRRSTSYFIIQNCTLFNASLDSTTLPYDAGITLHDVHNGMILNNNCSINNGIGIHLLYSNNMTLSNNKVSNNGDDGINFNHCSNNYIYNNTVSNNMDDGIILYTGSTNVILLNIIKNNNLDPGVSPRKDGGIFFHFSHDNIVLRNEISNNKYKGICAFRSNNISIRENNIANNTNAGIIFTTNNINIISENNITGSYRGIELWESNENIISNNTILNQTSKGITIDHCNNNNISENLFINNGDYGIDIFDCNNSVISENDLIDHNRFGITLASSFQNVVSKNIFLNNGEYAFLFVEGSNNTFLMNMVSNNSNGVYIGFSTNNTILSNVISKNINLGIYIQGSNCRYNTIYNNTIRTNGDNGVDDGVSNYWDNGSIGNYWSDYTGLDADNDGIGDTPYSIGGTAGIQDEYPLWWDQVSISINSPSTNEAFDWTAPNFSISIDKGVVFDSWYTIDSGLTNITFTGTTGSINQTEWDKKLDGSITVIFYTMNPLIHGYGYINSSEVNIIKDTTNPTLQINSPTPNELLGITAPSFNVEIYDTNLDSMWYTLDNGLTNTTLTTNGTISQVLWDALSNGTVTITFYANDSAGNGAFSSVTVRVDKNIPTIIINSPNSNELFTINAPSFNVEIKDTNLDTMWYTIDGGITKYFFLTNSSLNLAAWAALSDGVVTIQYYTNDTAGNSGFAEVTIRKDVNAPIITINSPQNSDVIGATAPNFDISIEELNLDKTWYSLNGGNNIAFTGLTGTIDQALWDALPGGDIIIRFYANDTLGRLGSQEVTVVKTISPPEIPGYNIIVLLGTISLITIFIIGRKFNKK